MELLERTIKLISPTDQKVKALAAQRLSEQAKPAGSLGMLEEIGQKISAITGTWQNRFRKKVIVTCAGDHGIVNEGVSLYPQEVTYQMVYNFVKGGASVNVFADFVNADVRVADIGVNYDFDPNLPIFHKKVRKGTSSFLQESAMSRDEAILSIERGIEIVNELFDKEGVDLLGTGDMGIGNTTPSTAIIAAFSGESVENLTGRGTGITDEMLNHKIDVIKKSLTLHKPDVNDPVDVLAKVGGLEIGALAGLVLGAAARKIPVVCDGLISTAGALLAYKLSPLVKGYLFAGHKSVEIGHRFMHREIGITPIVDLHFRLGEGTGAAVAMNIIELAAKALREIKTFEEVMIENKN